MKGNPDLSDIQTLFLVLAALYLSECLWWLPWNSCLFERWGSPAGKWKVRCPAGWPSSPKSALAVLWPLPSGLSLQADPPAFSFSPSGFTLWSPAAWTTHGRPERDASSWRWDEVETVKAVGSSILINNREILISPLRREADVLATLIESTARANENDREQILTIYLCKSTDPEEASRRLNLALATTRPLRALGSLLWIILFIVAPIVLSSFGGSLILASLAASFSIPLAFTVALFMKNHNQALPEERWVRIESALIMCVNWPMATRAATILGRHLLQGIHPVALALTFRGRKDQDAFVNRALRDFAYPLQIEGLSRDALETVEWSVRWYRSRFEELARESDLFTAPDSASPGGTTSVPAWVQPVTCRGENRCLPCSNAVWAFNRARRPRTGSTIWSAWPVWGVALWHRWSSSATRPSVRCRS